MNVLSFSRFAMIYLRGVQHKWGFKMSGVMFVFIITCTLYYYTVTVQFEKVLSHNRKHVKVHIVDTYIGTAWSHTHRQIRSAGRAPIFLVRATAPCATFFNFAPPHHFFSQNVCASAELRHFILAPTRHIKNLRHWALFFKNMSTGVHGDSSSSLLFGVKNLFNSLPL